MKIKSIVLFSLFYIGHFTHLNAQYIYGQVLDSKDSKPLSKASIRINTRGTLTDKNGNFKLSISDFNALNQHKIHISYVGYKTQEIPLSSSNSNLLIRLKENSEDLNEVIVSSSARGLVENALRKIPENYANHSYTLKGIISETNRQQRDEILYELKAIIAGKIEPISSKKKEVEVKIDAIDRKNHYGLDTISYVKWGGTAKIIEYFDFVRQREKVFDLKQTKKYHYFIEDIIQKNGRSTYKINVSNLKKKKELLGYMYIDQENLAFESMLFFKSNEDSLKLKNLSKNKINSTTVHTQYQLVDSTWYLSEIKINIEEIYQSIPTYINVNFIATEYDSTNILNLKYQERFQGVELLSDYANKGSAEEWAKIKTKISQKNQYYLEFDTISIPKKPIFYNQKNNYDSKFNQFYFKKIKLSTDFGLSTSIQNQTIKPEYNSDLINLPYGFSIAKEKFVGESSINGIIGLNIFLWKDLEIGLESKFSIPLINSQNETYYNYLLAYRYRFNKKHRPMSIRPSFHYGNLNVIKKLDELNSSKQQNEQLGLNDERLSIRLESQVKLLTLGLQFGIEVNKRKYLEIGLSYNAPTNASKEYWVFKETKKFLFNSEKKIDNNQTIYQQNNIFSISLTYKFLTYAK